jgi:cytochrome c-type biogenesis protein CcmH
VCVAPRATWSAVIAAVWFIAGALLGTVVTIVVLPLWGAARASGAHGRGYAIAGGCGAALAALALVIHFTVGAHHPPVPPSAGAMTSAGSGPAGSGTSAQSMDAAIKGLEARLTRNGGSDADWTLLAQAYEFQGRQEDARRARAHQPPVAAASVTEMSVESLVAAANSAAGGTPEEAGIAPPASLAELQARLRGNPRDAEAWLALASAQRTAHQDSAARDAYEKVIALHAMSAQSWADYADVLASLGGGSLGGAAGHAIDSALAADPANAKALWLKASQAHELHHYTDALAWWRKLLAVLPADSPDTRIINGNIAEDSQLAGLPAGSGNPAAAGDASAQVSGTVTIDTALAARVQPGATLFIYAKAADSPGPPLAVLRTSAGAWPVNFKLDDSMAMLPTRRLSQFDKVVIEARVSRSGQAAPSSGDLYVTSAVLRPLEGKKLALVINREIG